MSEVKSELKSARECIKTKDFKTALKHCKNVIKVDKDNYNAFVFIGVCAVELENFDQAKQAYDKAISKNPEHILAWQGLSTLYEKADRQEWTEDHFETYLKILQFHESEPSKWIEVFWKAVNWCKSAKNFALALKLLKIESIKEFENDVGKVLEEMLALQKNMFDSQRTADNLIELMAIMDKIIQLKEEKGVSAERECVLLLQNYIQAGELSSNESFPSDELMKEKAKVYVDKYTSNVQLLEIYCRMVVYSLSKLPSTAVLSEESYFKSLQEQKPELSLAKMGDGLMLLARKDFMSALAAFRKGLSMNNRDPNLHLLVAFAQHSLHSKKDAEKSISLVYNNLQNISLAGPRSKVLNCTRLLHIDILLSIGDSHSLQAASDTLSKMSEDCSDIMLREAELKFLKKDQEATAKIISQIEEQQSPALDVKERLLLLKARMSIVEAKYFDAEVRLQEMLELNDSSTGHLLLGQVYWKMAHIQQEKYQKAYTHFVQAAKLDAYNSCIFLNLGNYFRDYLKDKQKALKCYEKAFSLAPESEEIGISLGNLYLETGKEEEALKLYTTVTKSASVGQATWAWVRLGLVQLSTDHANEATSSFQHALRKDSKNSHYWECLADSYVARGSYTSALKSYQRALELNSSSTYCKYQIAKIQEKTGLFPEAIEIYKQILEDQADYIPAIVGAAQCYFHLQLDSLKKAMDRKGLQYAECALQFCARGLALKSNLCSLWKITADVCVNTHVIHPEQCSMFVPESIRTLLNIEIDDSLFLKTEILDLASRSYMVLVKLTDDMPSCWHDLGLSLYRHGVAIGGENGRNKVLQSIQVIKKSISLDGNNHHYWNSLGVVTGLSSPSLKCCGHPFDDVADASFSQHAFIKALQINDKDATAWTNLGTLYLKHDKIQEAHEAFKKALSSDPTYAPAWIGQASIAEIVGDDDAMDLFRHSTELHFHVEGSLGYSHWICSSFNLLQEYSIQQGTTPKPDISHLPSKCRRTVVNASAAMKKSVDREVDDICALNMLGLLLEHECLYHQAEAVFGRARSLLADVDQKESNKLKIVLENHARVLRYLENYQEAIDVYRIISDMTLEDYCGLALCYFKIADYENSMKVYERALQMATCDADKSCVQAAMGMVAYGQNDLDSTKSLLFKSIEYSKPCRQALIALSAFGMLYGDGKLAMASLNQLMQCSNEDSEQTAVSTSLLMSSFFLLQGQVASARKKISEAIHRYPHNNVLWTQMSQFVMKHSPGNTELLSRCVASSLMFGPLQAASQSSALSVLLYSSQSKVLLRFAQRLLHSRPDIAENWVLLSACMYAAHSVNNQCKKTLLSVSKYALSQADTQLNEHKQSASLLDNKCKRQNNLVAMSTNLYTWSMKQFVLTEIYYGNGRQGEMICDRLIPSFGADAPLREDFLFLKGLCVVQQGLSTTATPSLDIIRPMVALAALDKQTWKWMLLTSVYTEYNLPVAAELCFGYVMESRQRVAPSSTLGVFLQLAWLAVQMKQISQNEQWDDHSSQALMQASAMSELHPLVLFLRSITSWQKGNYKGAKKLAGRIDVQSDLILEFLVARFIEKLEID